LVEIKKNFDYTVFISGMTHEGQGVGRIDNFPIFIDGAILEEKVEIKIIKVNKSYAYGKLISIVEASKERVKPFCEVYDRCGGCSLQHMTYEAQLSFKTNTVKEALKRIGRFENIIVHDTLGMHSELNASEKSQSGHRPFNYRNKAQYPVGEVNNQAVTGFYAKRSHRIIESDVCGIQDVASNEIRKVFKEFLIEKNISTYNEIEGKGLVRHLVTRVGFRTGEIMVVVVLNGKDLPFKDQLVSSLVSRVQAIKSVFLNVNTNNTNVILGDKNIKIYGDDVITDYIGKYKFRISPLSFFQVNPIQTEVLYAKALEYAGLTGSEVVFDLYCGIGTISLFLSQKAKKVYGVEVIEDAVADARKNAQLNGVDNVEFIAGEVEKVIPQVKADVVVIDPPRKGCDEALLEHLVKMEPDRIVYVSCNPATLARDLMYLVERGYRVEQVQPVDMFPWTGCVECVVLLTNLTSK